MKGEFTKRKKMKSLFAIWGLTVVLGSAGLAAETNEGEVNSEDAVVIFRAGTKTARTEFVPRGTASARSVADEHVKRRGMILGMDTERKTFTSRIVIPGDFMRNPRLNDLRTISLLKGLRETACFMSTSMVSKEDLKDEPPFEGIGDGDMSMRASARFGKVRLSTITEVKTKSGRMEICESIKLKREGSAGEELASFVSVDEIIKVTSTVPFDKLLEILNAGTEKIKLNREIFVTEDGVSRTASRILSLREVKPDLAVDKAIKASGNKFSYAALVSVTL